MSALVVTADQAIVEGRARGATAVLAVDGAIVAVGDPADVVADPRAAGAQRLAWSRRAMVPGTINTHNHSFQSLLRGIGDDLPFLAWREQALYRYSPRLGAEDMGTAALFAFGEMLLHGVTTVCDFYYLNAQGNDHASATIEAARRLGMRIVLARCFYDWDGAPASYRETLPQAVANFEALARRYQDRARYLTTVQPAPHSQHGATPAMIEAGAGCARDAGTPWHIHLAEEEYQVRQSLERFGARPLHAVAALDVDASRMIAVHGCWFDAGERALLAERGAALAYCPGSNMFLGDGVTDLVDLVARGVRVGLGTDGGCSNNRVSVFDEMRTAALLQKVHRTDGQAIDAETCFALGTRTAGEVLDLPIGRIAPGYRCDLVALDLDDPSLWPIQALEKNVVYALSPRAVTDVVVDGQEVVAARRLCHVPLDEIQLRVSELTREWRRD
ncbi:MAG: amidohydrolase family protein [Deltaproteobacteria bacterium]|nr:amidohydrolase family protein [Deltaproteobacteria bacterium]MCW5808594.1 amidohydrolase family protein [Deltaproteobacteria bacterium]